MKTLWLCHIFALISALLALEGLGDPIEISNCGDLQNVSVEVDLTLAGTTELYFSQRELECDIGSPAMTLGIAGGHSLILTDIGEEDVTFRNIRFTVAGQDTLLDVQTKFAVEDITESANVVDGWALSITTGGQAVFNRHARFKSVDGYQNGGVYVDDGQVTFGGEATFTKIQTVGYGQAVYVGHDAQVTFNGGIYFEGDQDRSHGGAHLLPSSGSVPLFNREAEADNNTAVDAQRQRHLTSGPATLQFLPEQVQEPYPMGGNFPRLRDTNAQGQVDYPDHPPRQLDLPNILFVKPHKVGSTSMSMFVRLLAARNGGFEEEYKLGVDGMQIFTRKEMMPVKRGGLHIWTDHKTLQTIIPKSVTEVLRQSFKFTLVRDPVDRCLSAYYYYYATDFEVGKTKAEQTEHKLAFAACGTKEGNLLQMQEVAPSVNATVEETLKYYDFIGITGRYIDSLAVVKMLLGLRYGDMLFYDSKRSGNGHLAPRPPVSEEPPEVLEHFKGMTDPMDMFLWRAAEAKLDAIIAWIGPQFHEVHENIEKHLTAAREHCEPEPRDETEKVPNGFACYQSGKCKVKCLNRYASQHGLWEEEPRIVLPRFLHTSHWIVHG
ncbi:unnamed protein product [Discosporangium mesarthrocarpum]